VNVDSLGRYRIESKLGEGGMGVVWRAHDPQLGRDVALKVLPDALVADPEARARMLREARAVAALNHPNILGVYDVGEAEGHVYIAMEYVPGRPLSDLIQPAGLPVAEVLRLATQVAAALAHAHARGIIHRDIKPSNVLVTPEGNAKVLDFGIATKASGTSETRTLALTAPGTLVGTPEVMAPEIWKGEPADTRSDVWALGALIHTMLDGRAPFVGSTAHEVSAAILHGAPEPLPERAPPALRAVVTRCLEREPERRYRSAAEVHAALQAIEAGTGPVPKPASKPFGKKLVLIGLLVLLIVGGWVAWRWFRPAAVASRITSLAVLPLENISHDPQRQYLADGMTEELITRLAQLGVVRVISRTSVMRFQNASIPLQDIAHQLGVDAIVEGSVEQVGDRVRVSAQLMRAANEEHLWGKSYEREVGDALALQDEIAGAIAQEVGGALALPAARPAPARPTHGNDAAHAAAVQAYLRGRDEYQHWTFASNRQALEHYDRALALDSTFTPALAARASSLLFISASPETIALARAAVTKALAVDPGIGEAHAEYGKLLYGTDWDWQGAEREFKRAIELNPNDSDAHHHYSHLLLALGRPKEARDEANLMVSLDPLAPATWNHMAFLDYMAGDMAATARDENKALELDPGYGVSYNTFLDIAFLKRDWPAFPVLFARMRAAGVPVDSFYVQMIAAVQHGRKTEAWQAMRSMVSKDDPYPWAFTHMAGWALAAGDREEAFAWLDKGFKTRDYELLYIKYDPALASLRSDPRYGALRDRMRLPR